MEAQVLELRSGKSQVIGDLDDYVGPFEWRKDGKSLVAGRLQKGRFYLESIPLDGKVSRALTAPAGEDFALLPEGAIAYVESGMNRPPELARAVPGEKARVLTSFNTEQYAGLDWGRRLEDSACHRRRRDAAARPGAQAARGSPRTPGRRCRAGARRAAGLVGGSVGMRGTRRRSRRGDMWW